MVPVSFVGALGHSTVTLGSPDNSTSGSTKSVETMIQLTEGDNLTIVQAVVQGGPYIWYSMVFAGGPMEAIIR